jgi:hypothetical protein
MIVFWASNTYKTVEMTGSVILTLFYFGVKWSVRVKNSPEIVYSFWAETNIDQLTNFDLYAFVRYLRDRLAIFNNN